MLFARAIIGSMVFMSSAYASTISGTYVGKGGNSVALVQIVETADGHLTGRFEQFAMEPDGKTKNVNASLTGVRDGEMVVVTIKPPEFMSNSITASGTCANGILHLTGGGEGINIAWNLNKSEEADFRGEVAALTGHANEIMLTRQRKELATKINETARQMTAFASWADGGLKYFAGVEQRYRALTGTMRLSLSQARSIYGDGQASVARSQIYVSINQASLEAEQLHNSVASVSQDFATKAGGLITDLPLPTSGARVLRQKTWCNQVSRLCAMPAGLCPIALRGFKVASPLRVANSPA